MLKFNDAAAAGATKHIAFSTIELFTLTSYARPLSRTLIWGAFYYGNRDSGRNRDQNQARLFCADLDQAESAESPFEL